MCEGNGELFFKIGITSKTIQKRFCGKFIPYNYTVLFSFIGDPSLVYKSEKLIHKHNRNYRYMPKLKFHGKTECFSSIDYSHVLSLVE